ncbi:hypothetical protein FACS1894193_08780 [Bacilli bacterium]|nr:hypothetical protein FACS1894193_08780 [Bacilli bacterium]GHU46158.1 hypothetical protein FACS1894194_3360 [Bacilli bacterium]
MTLANVHDSQILGVLVSPNEPLFDDSAYAGQKVPKGVKHHSAKRAYRNTPLTDA